MKTSSVVVVGGGVIGLACAWELARRGLEVALLEAETLGGGVSSGNAGLVCPSLLPAGLREETVGLFAAYEEAGVELELHRQGLVVAARTAAGLERYRRSGRLLGPHEAAELEPALDADAIAGAVHADADAHVKPETLLLGLARSAAVLGADLREGWPVDGVARGGREWVVASPRGEVAAAAVVVAAGLRSAGLLRPHRPQPDLHGVRGYSVDVASWAGPRPRHALYLAEARLAVSPFAGPVRIAGLLEPDGRPRRTDLAALAAPYLRRRPVAAGPVWTGVRPATPDGVPLVRPVAKGLYVAAGHGMFGVTLAPATARKLARWIA